MKFRIIRVKVIWMVPRHNVLVVSFSLPPLPLLSRCFLLRTHLSFVIGIVLLSESDLLRRLHAVAFWNGAGAEWRGGGSEREIGRSRVNWSGRRLSGKRVAVVVYLDVSRLALFPMACVPNVIVAVG